MAKLGDLVTYLQRNGIPFELIEHELTFTAHQTAAATHIEERNLAKPIIVKIEGRFWMAVIRGDMHLSETLLKHALAVKDIHLAHEDELTVLFPDCQIGAMPPFGNLYGLPIIVDEELAQDEVIVFNACSHTKAMKIRFADFKRLVHPVTGEIAVFHHAHHATEAHR